VFGDRGASEFELASEVVDCARAAAQLELVLAAHRIGQRGKHVDVGHAADYASGISDASRISDALNELPDATHSPNLHARVRVRARPRPRSRARPKRKPRARRHCPATPMRRRSPHPSNQHVTRLTNHREAPATHPKLTHKKSRRGDRDSRGVELTRSPRGGSKAGGHLLGATSRVRAIAKGMPVLLSVTGRSRA
jgi:hypothetical protein